MLPSFVPLSSDVSFTATQELFRRLGEPITLQEAHEVVKDMNRGDRTPKRGISFAQFLGFWRHLALNRDDTRGAPEARAAWVCLRTVSIFRKVNHIRVFVLVAAPPPCSEHATRRVSSSCVLVPLTLSPPPFQL